MKVIWLAFSILFISLAIFHFIKAKQKIGHFTNKGKIKTSNTAPLGVSEFIFDFNVYIDNLNKENNKINIIAGCGYVLAGLTAILTFIL